MNTNFISFLDELKSTNPTLIEAVSHGYNIIFEAGVVKEMDHSGYMEKLRDETKYPESALRYIMKDAKAAMDAMPDGPNAGYYQDEIHYCAMELNRRRKAAERGMHKNMAKFFKQPNDMDHRFVDTTPEFKKKFVTAEPRSWTYNAYTKASDPRGAVFGEIKAMNFDDAKERVADDLGNQQDDYKYYEKIELAYK